MILKKKKGSTITILSGHLDEFSDHHAVIKHTWDNRLYPLLPSDLNTAIFSGNLPCSALQFTGDSLCPAQSALVGLIPTMPLLSMLVILFSRLLHLHLQFLCESFSLSLSLSPSSPPPSFLSPPPSSNYSAKPFPEWVKVGCSKSACHVPMVIFFFLTPNDKEKFTHIIS